MSLNTEALRRVQQERMDLALRKNADYSGAVDTIAAAGLPGLAARLMDKAGRLLSLTRPGIEARVRDESVRDTLLDMANYAEYGVLLVDGTWNAEKAGLRFMIEDYVQDQEARSAMLKRLDRAVP